MKNPLKEYDLFTTEQNTEITNPVEGLDVAERLFVLLLGLLFYHRITDCFILVCVLRKSEQISLRTHRKKRNLTKHCPIRSIKIVSPHMKSAVGHILNYYCCDTAIVVVVTYPHCPVVRDGGVIL
ncbi:hypothetical protein CDAR_55251 [Caerostris darwini]|uniref:Uncharacterized protein n=1 Tax=Caerostris darwini TaxID=1538125 RepID=A0AAV4R4T6_9ARAC|nr:hypothetical protein CDAR_55251 [Caerostris darwini]